MKLRYSCLKKKGSLVLLLTIFSNFAFSQINRYALLLTDKQGTQYSVDRPEEFLSQRALDRRTKQNIVIEENDLPVSPDYVSGIEMIGGSVIYTSKWMNAVIIEADVSLLSFFQDLEYVDSIELVAFDEFPAVALPVDGANIKSDETIQKASILEQVNAAQNSMHGIDLLHEEGFKGEGMLIGVFDTGFPGVDQIQAFKHLFDKNRIIMAYNLISKSQNVYQFFNHGSSVFSIMAAVIEDEYVGASPAAEYMLFVTEDAFIESRSEEYNWLRAAEMADSAGVDIINTSLGYANFFQDPSMNYEYADLDGKTTVIARASNLAFSKGILTVSGAGNFGNSEWKYIATPSDSENVLAVGSVDISGKKSTFSSIGPTSDGRIKPDVMAVGEGTIRLLDNGQIAGGNGTSFASPLITSFAALLWSKLPELTNKELMDTIRQLGSAIRFPNSNFGYGIPKYKKISTITGLESESLLNVAVYPNPASDILRINFDKALQKTAEFSFFNQAGSNVIENLSDLVHYTDHIEINTSNLEAGLYYLRIESGTDIVKTHQIVIY